MQRNAGSRGVVAVVMGGSSLEREISIKSGSEVLRALQSLGYDARSLDYDERFFDAIGQIKPDVVFIALHGPGGEDGHVQALLEYLQIP
jgi:D-alanine-D-alanine ligase